MSRRWEKPSRRNCMFEDRRDAGRQLALALETYGDGDVLVLAVPRGGVVVGYEVACHLGADLSLIVTRKLPYLDDPEAGFGAIAEDGSTVILDRAAQRLPDSVVRDIIHEQKEEISRRVAVLRRGQPLPGLASRRVILVDDGLAMGSTMRASIMLCKRQGAGEIIVAVPVASSRVAAEISEEVDEIIVLKTPRRFRAVAQVYGYWHDVSDAEVLTIMAAWREERSHSSEGTDDAEGQRHHGAV
jgi:predicted phosphoribosyltransferase